MSELQFPVELIDDGTHQEKYAYTFVCACSNVEDNETCEVFYAFIEPASGHLHLQCYDCEQTYCPHKICVPPPTVESIPQ